MRITKLNIVGRSGANGTPGFGYATFSDGREYTFLRLPDDNFTFGGWRTRHGTVERFTFQSAQRAAALTAYLDA